MPTSPLNIIYVVCHDSGREIGWRIGKGQVPRRAQSARVTKMQQGRPGKAEHCLCHLPGVRHCFHHDADLVSGRRMTQVRRVPAWRSATAGVEGADCYTAYGFANPTRRVLAGVLHTRAEVRALSLEYGENG